MSDTAHAPPVRPMTQGDYAQGQPVPVAHADHPTRDLIVAAFVGAAALWIVPRVFDFATDYFTGGDELELDEG